MSLRTIHIPPFRLPSGAVTSATVVFSLVDAAGRKLIGLRSSDGSPVAGVVTVAVAAQAVSVALTPNTEIAPTTRYLVQTTAAGNVIQRVSVQIPAGGTSLDWAELIDSGEPLSPADLSALSLHLADDNRHLTDDDRDTLVRNIDGGRADTLWGGESNLDCGGAL